MSNCYFAEAAPSCIEPTASASDVDPESADTCASAVDQNAVDHEMDDGKSCHHGSGPIAKQA